MAEVQETLILNELGRFYASKCYGEVELV